MNNYTFFRNVLLFVAISTFLGACRKDNDVAAIISPNNIFSVENRALGDGDLNLETTELQKLPTTDVIKLPTTAKFLTTTAHIVRQLPCNQRFTDKSGDGYAMKNAWTIKNKKYTFESNTNLYRISVPQGSQTVVKIVPEAGKDLDIFAVDHKTGKTVEMSNVENSKSKITDKIQLKEGDYTIFVQAKDKNNEGAFEVRVSCEKLENKCILIERTGYATTAGKNSVTYEFNALSAEKITKWILYNESTKKTTTTTTSAAKRSSTLTGIGQKYTITVEYENKTKCSDSFIAD